MTSLRNARSQRLLNGPVAGMLFLFALPMLGTSILQSLNGSINAMWVGRLLGAAELAATTNANLMLFLILAMAFGLGSAATIMVGQSIGRGDLPGARKAIGSGTGLFLALGLTIGVAGWMLSADLLALMNTPPEMAPSALIYLRTLFAALPPGLVTVFLAMALRGTGDAMTPLLAMIPGTLVDVALNPVLILGIGPLPRLGILGAGVAGIIASLISLIVLVFIIYRRDLPIRLRGSEWRYLLPSLPLVGQILRIGLPMGLQAIAMAGSTLVMLELINRQGVMTVAAYGAVNQLWTYVQMPGMAIGLAASAMAAQNIGAGKWCRVDRIAWSGVLLGLAITVSLILLSFLIETVLLAIFLDKNLPALDVASRINLIASWAFVFQAPSMALASVMRANGATVMPLAIMFVAFVPIRLGVAYGFYPAMGADAIWSALPAGALALLVLTALYYISNRWRHDVDEDAASTAVPDGNETISVTQGENAAGSVSVLSQNHGGSPSPRLRRRASSCLL